MNQLTNMVDAVGTTAFSYTPAGRLQSENGPWANDTLTYTYVQGLRTALTLSQTTSNWSQGYGYDSGWRLQTLTSPAGSFNYSYNFQPASALVTGIQLPNGANIVNSYDSLARLTGTVLNNYWGHTLDGYSNNFDALGLRTNIVRNLGLTSSTVTAGFDNIGQVTSWNANEAGGTPRQNEQLGFGYDAAHNLHTRNNGNLAQTFTTDAANQLNSVTRNGTFTLAGATPAPATSITVNGQTAQIYGDFTFAQTNLILANGYNTFTNIAQNTYGLKVTNILTVNFPQSVTLGFDNNGSLTNDGAILYGYDSENQLTNMTVAANWKSDFVYDGLNRRRIERDYYWQSGSWAKTNETHFIYDGYLLVQERASNNVPLVTYTRGLDLSKTLQRAGGIGGLLARTDTNGTTYYHADGNGNITALIDAQENIIGRYLYSPFGKLTGMWGSMASANAMQFSSMPVHRLSGMPHLPFRDLDTTLPGFLTADPIGERGGTPLRGFVYNNPQRYIDPFGLAGGGSSGGMTEEFEPGKNSELRDPKDETPIEQFENRMAQEEAARLRNRDPNETYLDPVPGETRPLTEEEWKDDVKNVVSDFNKMRNHEPCSSGGVYALRDPNSGDVMRTERSNDLARRRGEHGRDPRFEDFNFEPIYRTDNYPEQRGLEQMAHDQYKPPFNYVNPVSPGNPNYQNYMNSAQQYIGNSK